MQKSLVPYTIECFAYIANDGSYFKSIIKSLTKCIIYVSKLIHSRISRNKSRLEWCNDIISVKIIEDMFINYFVWDFSKRAQQRNSSAILILKKNWLNISFFPNSWYFRHFIANSWTILIEKLIVLKHMVSTCNYSFRQVSMPFPF